MKKHATLITIIGLILLVVFDIWMLGTMSRPWIITSLNILFHEAGHWIFGMFGQFIGVAGGTIMELLVPAVFIVYFWGQRNIPGQVFGYFWLTTAFYNVSIYASDARAQILPLIGGPGGHDWFYMLGRLRLLDSDIFIGRIFLLCAWLATGYMVYLIYKYYSLRNGRIIS